jgi:hypothetical protein
VQTKEVEHEEMMAKVDGQHKFKTIVSKWRKISIMVMKEGCSEHVRSGPTCKDKWSSIASDFKKTFDFMASIRQNQKYWAVSTQEINNIQFFYNFG